MAPFAVEEVSRDRFYKMERVVVNRRRVALPQGMRYQIEVAVSSWMSLSMPRPLSHYLGLRLQLS